MSRGRYVPERGDLIWLHFTPHAGHEQSGRRPALVLSPAIYNERVGLAQVAPITTKIKKYPYEVALPQGGPIIGVVLADQLKSVDWQDRRAEFIAKVGDDEILNEVVGKQLALIDPDAVYGGESTTDESDE